MRAPGQNETEEQVVSTSKQQASELKWIRIFWVAQPCFWVTSAEQKEAQNMKHSADSRVQFFFKTIYKCTYINRSQFTR